MSSSRRQRTVDEPLRARVRGVVRLRDGRRIGFTEFGRPGARTILWFHGTPGSSTQVPPAARRAACHHGVRLIGVERPGYGRSTPHRYGAVIEWAADVREVVDALGAERFGLIGLSGGGAYVLACAHEMPTRVVGAALLGGVAPGCGDDGTPGGLVSIAVTLGPVLPLVAEPLARVMRRVIQVIRPVAHAVAPATMEAVLPAIDYRALADPALRRVFVDDVLRASRYSFLGPAFDARLFGRPWGFALSDVRVPVRLWQGDADVMVPLAHARHQAARLRNATLSVRPGDGHLGMLAAADEVVAELVAAWPDDRRGSRDVG